MSSFYIVGILLVFLVSFISFTQLANYTFTSDEDLRMASLIKSLKAVGMVAV